LGKKKNPACYGQRGLIP